MNCQVYCWEAEDQKLDLVEGSNPSKTEKETAGREGAGNVKALASNDRNRERERGLY
jgi:hypothetical protein